MNLPPNADKPTILKLATKIRTVLNELDWKLIKAERALYIHQTSLQECTEKLQANQQRASETKMALQFLSAGHPLRHQCEDDLYKTEIRILRLQNRLKRFSNLKSIQLEIKKIVLTEEISYYNGILKAIDDLLNPPLIVRTLPASPEGEAIKKERRLYESKLKDEYMVLIPFSPDVAVQLCDDALHGRW